ncbi:MAG: methylated-DNA--[protein]-cysteine S-methyltransferase [Alphaproteobacteria bacterium]|nr:methylated-DNA--[protein]-cysteine S-methyltransferase [Alphaproteobacteria bacterium]
MPACLMDSPVGPLLLVEDGGRLAEVRFADGDEPDRDNTPLLKRVQKQIDEFFAGNRRKFDLPLAPARTAFQQRVREAMISIPWGQTLSYGEIAHIAGGAPRAVGQACGANMLPLVVPCHRVLAANGIGGYSGAKGLDTKRFLLALEKAGPAG